MVFDPIEAPIFNAGTLNEFQNITINKVVELGSDINIISGKTFTLNSSSTLIFRTYAIKGEGNFETNHSASLRIGSPVGISATGPSGNIQVTGTRFYHPNTLFRFIGFVSQITGDGIPSNVSNLYIQNYEGVTLSKNITTDLLGIFAGKLFTGSNTLTLSGGMFTQNNGYVVGNLAQIISYAGPFLLGHIACLSFGL